MTDLEDLFKAGVVFIVGAIILSAAGTLAITPGLINTFERLGIILIIVAIIVGVLTKIIDALR